MKTIEVKREEVAIKFDAVMLNDVMEEKFTNINISDLELFAETPAIIRKAEIANAYINNKITNSLVIKAEFDVDGYILHKDFNFGGIATKDKDGNAVAPHTFISSEGKSNIVKLAKAVGIDPKGAGYVQLLKDIVGKDITLVRGNQLIQPKDKEAKLIPALYFSVAYAIEKSKEAEYSFKLLQLKAEEAAKAAV